MDGIEEIDVAKMVMQRASEKVSVKTETVLETDSDQEPEPKEPDPNDDDFDDDMPDEIREGDKDTHTITGKIAGTVAVGYDPEKLATKIVDGVSQVFEIAGPYAFEFSLSKDDRANLKALAYKYKQHGTSRSTMELTETDQAVMTIYIDMMDYEGTLSMTKDEKASLVEPLVAILKEANVQTSPTWALIIAAFFVLLPRLLPIIRNFFR